VRSAIDHAEVRQWLLCLRGGYGLIKGVEYEMRTRLGEGGADLGKVSSYQGSITLSYRKAHDEDKV